MHNRKPKQRNTNFRVFWRAALTCFFLLILITGFIIADYNTRQVGFGSGSMRIEIFTKEDSVYVNMLGREQAYEMSEQLSKWTGRLWNVLPPVIRAMFWMFEGECVAATEVLK